MALPWTSEPSWEFSFLHVVFPCYTYYWRSPHSATGFLTGQFIHLLQPTRNLNSSLRCIHSFSPSTPFWHDFSFVLPVPPAVAALPSSHLIIRSFISSQVLLIVIISTVSSSLSKPILTLRLFQVYLDRTNQSSLNIFFVLVSHYTWNSFVVLDIFIWSLFVVVIIIFAMISIHGHVSCSDTDTGCRTRQLSKIPDTRTRLYMNILAEYVHTWLINMCFVYKLYLKEPVLVEWYKK